MRHLPGPENIYRAATRFPVAGVRKAPDGEALKAESFGAIEPVNLDVTSLEFNRCLPEEVRLMTSAPIR
jgi:hypothetical protein